MDSPDATFAGDRGLLAPTPTPPMRSERRSGPVRDPIQGQSLVPVTKNTDVEIGVPASSGNINTSRIQEAPHTPVVSQMSANVGHVVRNEERLQHDFERVIDRRYSFAPANGSSQIDRGYATGSYLSPLTAGQPGRDRVQQSVSMYAMYGEQLAHINPTVTDVGAGVEPLTMQRSMSLARCQSGATPTHTHTYTTNTVDACLPTHTHC